MAGCVGASLRSRQPWAPGYWRLGSSAVACVKVIRRGWYGTFGGARSNVFLDGDLVATIGREDVAWFGVEAGTHVVVVDEPGMECPNRSTPLEVTVQPGETVVLEMTGGEFRFGDPKLRVCTDSPRSSVSPGG